MNKIIMQNPKNLVTIETTENYKAHWEKLGFVETNCKIIKFPMSA